MIKNNHTHSKVNASHKALLKEPTKPYVCICTALSIYTVLSLYIIYACSILENRLQLKLFMDDLVQFV